MAAAAGGGGSSVSAAVQQAAGVIAALCEPSTLLESSLAAQVRVGAVGAGAHLDLGGGVRG
jgi:hypothetical protein